jgi:hypothetical protein
MLTTVVVGVVMAVVLIALRTPELTEALRAAIGTRRAPLPARWTRQPPEQPPNRPKEP